MWPRKPLHFTFPTTDTYIHIPHFLQVLLGAAGEPACGQGHSRPAGGGEASAAGRGHAASRVLPMKRDREGAALAVATGTDAGAGAMQQPGRSACGRSLAG